jgi:CubicO group peptidase (beta-lactamase class C family)
MELRNLDKVDGAIPPLLRAARIPGAAVAIVAGGHTVFAQGYGLCDVAAKRPTTAHTIYPIASTSKALNATLLGMLVDDGLLGWDVPIQAYMPRFRLQDPLTSAQVTLRDLVALRTGLPRHDYVWIDCPIGRPELVERLRYLDSSAGFREKFQYSNITATTAGHVAEVVTGRGWEELVQERILRPLRMANTWFTPPATGDVSQSYHETGDRELALSERLACDVTAPSGGSIHSTVEDMARWMAFNLSGGQAGETRLIQSDTLLDIHAPQIVARSDPSAPSPTAVYGLGWFIDNYQGYRRIGHGGYVHDVNSEVTLFPEDGIGIVSFTNFGFPTLARLINQYVFDILKGFTPQQTVEEKLAFYECKVAENRARLASVRRVEGTAPSHPLSHYAGLYSHPGYGSIDIVLREQELIFKRHSLVLPLEHWHFDAWVAKDSGRFFIHVAHAFDRENRLLFGTNVDGDIDAVSIRLEPAVAPIQFKKQPTDARAAGARE